MEVPVSSAAISLVLVTFLTLAWKAMNSLWLTPKKMERCLRNQGFRGNPYKVLTGDIKDIMSVRVGARSVLMDISDDNILPRVLPLHHHWVKSHGKCYFQWLGPTPRITITDPKLVKEIFINRVSFTRPREPNSIILTGLLAYEGDKWVKHRNLLNPAFHLEKLKRMVPAMYSSCSEMIRKWEELASKTGSCEVDAWPYMSDLTGDMISRTMFGSNYEEGKGIFKLQKTICELALQPKQWPYLPGSRYLPTERNKKVKAIQDEVRTVLTRIISKRKETSEDEGNDLLGILLKSNLEAQGSKNRIVLTTDEVIAECKLFYLAGQETTSCLLIWALVLLSKHPKWQALAREEVAAVFGDNEPEPNGLNQLKTVTMILNEVLRLYSPSAYTTRAVYKETKLGDLSLPPGTEICIPTLAIHLDPKNWGEDATEFKPERFSEGIAKATNGQSTFLPFGAGPRICIGQNFAMMEAKIALAMILKHFTFHLSPSYVHAPYHIITVHPQHGAPLILQKI